MKTPEQITTWGGGKRILFVPDVHAPLHDKAAVALMLAAAKDFKPDIIVVIGDMFDFASLSAHPRDDMDGESDFLTEMRKADRQVLRKLDELGAEMKIFCEGNHETRLPRKLAKDAPALFSSLDLRKLLKLKSRGWAWVPYRSVHRLGKIHLSHEVGESGRFAADRSVRGVFGSVVVGHGHSMQVAYTGTILGKRYVGAMFGWLGSPGAGRYLHSVKQAHMWQLGFGTGIMAEDGIVWIQAHPIIVGKSGYRTEVNGKVYTLRSQHEAKAKSTGAARGDATGRKGTRPAITSGQGENKTIDPKGARARSPRKGGTAKA